MQRLRKGYIYLYIVLLFGAAAVCGYASERAGMQIPDSLLHIQPEDEQLLVEDGYVDAEYLDQWRDEQEEALQVADYSSANEVYKLSEISVDTLIEKYHLSPKQAKGFLRYKEHAGEYITLYMLKEIGGWDGETINKVLPYFRQFRVANRQLASSIEKPRELNWRSSLSVSGPFYAQTKTGYIGQPYEVRAMSRISTHRIAAGLLADKDRNEPFFMPQRGISSFERYSFFFAVKQPIKYIQDVVVGDYTMQLGQGLVSRNSFMRGVVPLSMAAIYSQAKLSPALQSSYTGHYRGVAAKLGGKYWELLLGYSYQRLDGLYDSITHSVKSISFDRPYRTEKELLKRHNFMENSYVGRLALRSNLFTFGVNGIYVDWGGVTLASALPGYAANAAARNIKNAYTISADAAYASATGALQLACEGALSQQRGNAFLASGSYTSNDFGRFFLSMRYLNPSFFSRRGVSLSHWNPMGNEWGLYASYSGRLFRNWQVKSYVDYYRSIRPRYHKKQSTEAVEGFIDLSWKPLSSLRCFTTFTERVHLGQGQYMRIMSGAQWKANSKFSCSLWGQWKFFIKSGALANKQLSNSELASSAGIGTNSHGFLFTGKASYVHSPSFQCTLTTAYFYTQNFFTRQYIYAPKVLYASSSKMRYGQGVDIQLFLKGKWNSFSWQTSLSYIHTARQQKTPSTPSGWEGALTLQYRLKHKY